MPVDHDLTINERRTRLRGRPHGRARGRPHSRPNGTGWRAARSRVRALVVVVVTLLLGTVAVAGPARSAEWIVLCTGYDACQSAVYSYSGYKQNNATSYWR